jgi:hypothetical protein
MGSISEGSDRRRQGRGDGLANEGVGGEKVRNAGDDSIMVMILTVVTNFARIAGWTRANPNQQQRVNWIGGWRSFYWCDEQRALSTSQPNGLGYSGTNVCSELLLDIQTRTWPANDMHETGDTKSWIFVFAGLGRERRQDTDFG